MPDNRVEGFAWQLRVWDRMADVYEKEIDTSSAGARQEASPRLPSPLRGPARTTRNDDASRTRWRSQLRIASPPVCRRASLSYLRSIKSAIARSRGCTMRI
jgi:hypothetical protein